MREGVEGLLHLLNFQATDDWLVNRAHTGKVKLTMCHAC